MICFIKNANLIWGDVRSSATRMDNPSQWPTSVHTVLGPNLRRRSSSIHHGFDDCWYHLQYPSKGTVPVALKTKDRSLLNSALPSISARYIRRVRSGTLGDPCGYPTEEFLRLALGLILIKC